MPEPGPPTTKGIRAQADPLGQSACITTGDRTRHRLTPCTLGDQVVSAYVEIEADIRELKGEP